MRRTKEVILHLSLDSTIHSCSVSLYCLTPSVCTTSYVNLHTLNVQLKHKLKHNFQTDLSWDTYQGKHLGRGPEHVSKYGLGEGRQEDEGMWDAYDPQQLTAARLTHLALLQPQCTTSTSTSTWLYRRSKVLCSKTGLMANSLMVM